MIGKGTLRTKEEKARIVMEVLSNSSTIAEICRKYNVASSAVYSGEMNSSPPVQRRWNRVSPR